METALGKKRHRDDPQNYISMLKWDRKDLAPYYKRIIFRVANGKTKTRETNAQHHEVLPYCPYILTEYKYAS